MKKSVMPYILIFFLLLPLFATARTSLYHPGTEPVAEDSILCSPLSLHFRLGLSLLERDYMENSGTLSLLHSLLGDSLSASRIDTVTVFAYASPEGDEEYNRGLAVRRAAVVKSYLVGRYSHLDRNRILTRPAGEDWTGLRRLVAEDADVPDREEVLALLNHASGSGRCKQLLQRLNCGYAYRYIYRHILPQLRNATLCTVQLKRPEYPGVLDARLPVSVSLSGIAMTAYAAATTKEIPAILPNFASPSVMSRFNPLLAVKTNLIFDLALAPNIEFELPLGRNNRWSLNAEWVFPWWLIDNDKYCFQILYGGVEGRYWLGHRVGKRPLTGHFFGLYAGAGKYDLQWDRDGYQGEFYIASGISYGYSMPVARRLNLEFSLGVGLLRTNYKYYHAVNDYRTLLWQNDGTYTWFGPTKLKVSLVWMLGGKWGKGGAR